MGCSGLKKYINGFSELLKPQLAYWSILNFPKKFFEKKKEFCEKVKL